MILLDELLPRREIVADVAAMRSFIGGRRVLVTGAGGSIGSEPLRTLVPELVSASEALVLRS